MGIIYYENVNLLESVLFICYLTKFVGQIKVSHSILLFVSASLYIRCVNCDNIIELLYMDN